MVVTFLSVLELCSAGQAGFSGGPGSYEIYSMENAEELPDGTA